MDPHRTLIVLSSQTNNRSHGRVGRVGRRWWCTGFTTH